MSVIRNTVLLATALLLLCACASQEPADFFAADSARSSQQMIAVQLRQGAVEDATLHPVHFEQGQLNALGADKLELMLAGRRADRPMKLYLDLPGDSAAAQQSVEQYLAAAGLSAADYNIIASANPELTHPARLPKPAPNPEPTTLTIAPANP